MISRFFYTFVTYVTTFWSLAFSLLPSILFWKSGDYHCFSSTDFAFWIFMLHFHGWNFSPNIPATFAITGVHWAPRAINKILDTRVIGGV